MIPPSDVAGRDAGFRDPRVLVPFVLITLIWGSTWIVIKDQLGTVPPVWSVSYRFVLAGAAMFVMARLSGASLRLGPGGHGPAFALGVLQFVLNYNFVYAAEIHITSGLVAVLFALLLVPNALLAWACFGERVTGRFVLGSAVALAGVALLFVQEARLAGGAPRPVLTGIGFTLLAVLAASASNVMQLSGAVRARPIATMLAWAMVYGALLDAAIAWAIEGPPVFEMRVGYWLGLLYLSVIASSLAFWLYFGVIRAVGPAKAAYAGVLIPILAMVISTIFEGYRWSPLAFAGGALALAGLVVALRAGRPAPERCKPAAKGEPRACGVEV